MSSRSLIVICLLAAAVSATSGPTLEYLDHELTKTHLQMIRLYRAQHDGISPTNWNQLHPNTNNQHLARMERSFKSYGKAGGVRTSIVEKFVFIPPGVRMPNRPRSQVLMMSSAPYTRGREFGRFVIFDDIEPGLENQTLRYGRLKEEWVQRMMKEAGVRIPEPQSAPPLRVEEPDGLTLQEHLEWALETIVQKAKSVFVTSPNRAAPQAAQPQWKVVPLTLAALASVCAGVLGYRWLRHRRTRRR